MRDQKEYIGSNLHGNALDLRKGEDLKYISLFHHLEFGVPRTMFAAHFNSTRVTPPVLFHGLSLHITAGPKPGQWRRVWLIDYEPCNKNICMLFTSLKT
jgi:hypothetical protein